MTVKDIKLYGDRVLIKPLKQYTYKVKQLKFNEQDNLAVEGKYETDPEKLPDTQVEEVEQEIVSDTQKAIVLAKGQFANIPCEEGDTIIYNYKASVPFELIKGVVMIKQNDVVAILNK